MNLITPTNSSNNVYQNIQNIINAIKSLNNNTVFTANVKEVLANNIYKLSILDFAFEVQSSTKLAKGTNIKLQFITDEYSNIQGFKLVNPKSQASTVNNIDFSNEIPLKMNLQPSEILNKLKLPHNTNNLNIAEFIINNELPATIEVFESIANINNFNEDAGSNTILKSTAQMIKKGLMQSVELYKAFDFVTSSNNNLAKELSTLVSSLNELGENLILPKDVSLNIINELNKFILQLNNMNETELANVINSLMNSNVNTMMSDFIKSAIATALNKNAILATLDSGIETLLNKSTGDISQNNKLIELLNVLNNQNIIDENALIKLTDELKNNNKDFLLKELQTIERNMIANDKNMTQIKAAQSSIDDFNNKLAIMKMINLSNVHSNTNEIIQLEIPVGDDKRNHIRMLLKIKYKNKKGKNNKKSMDDVKTIYINMEMSKIGKLAVNINIEKKHVNVGFLVTNNKVKKTFLNDMHSLTKELQEIGLAASILVRVAKKKELNSFIELDDENPAGVDLII